MVEGEDVLLPCIYVRRRRDLEIGKLLVTTWRSIVEISNVNGDVHKALEIHVSSVNALKKVVVSIYFRSRKDVAKISHKIASS